jgi:transposase
LENLTDIRERSRRCKGKKASKEQCKANGQASRWAFAQLQGAIADKAVLAGSMVIKVDASL